MPLHRSSLSHEFKNEHGGNIICTFKYHDGSICERFPEEHPKKELFLLVARAYIPGKVYRDEPPVIEEKITEESSVEEAVEAANRLAWELFAQEGKIIEVKVHTQGRHTMGFAVAPR